MTVFSSVFVHISSWEFFLYFALLLLSLCSVILRHSLLYHTEEYWSTKKPSFYWRKRIVLRHRQRPFPVKKAKLNTSSFMPSISPIFLHFFHPVKALAIGQAIGVRREAQIIPYPVGLHENLYSQIKRSERECCNLSSSPVSSFPFIGWYCSLFLSVTYFLYEFYVRANTHVRGLLPWTCMSMTKEGYNRIQRQK